MAIEESAPGADAPTTVDPDPATLAGQLREVVAASERAATDGRYGEALAANDTAAELVSRLRAAEPDDANHEMAAAGLLHNRSRFLSHVGHAEEAVAAAAESAAIFRRLVALDERFYPPYLADALVRLGMALHGAGRTAAALEAIAEAVHLFRELIFAVPQHRADLARTLVLMGEVLAAAGRGTDSARAMIEAVELFRALPQPDLEVDGPAFAMALHTLAVASSEAGRSGAALDLSREAIAIQRQMAQSRSVARDKLADMLVEQAVILSEAGYTIDARKAIDEAIGWFERQPTDSAASESAASRQSRAYVVRESITGTN